MCGFGVCGFRWVAVTASRYMYRSVYDQFHKIKRKQDKIIRGYWDNTDQSLPRLEGIFFLKKFLKHS